MVTLTHKAKHSVFLFPNFVLLSHKLVLAMSACHLPLQGLNHVLLQLLTSNTPLKVFREEIRNEALSPRKLAGQVFK